MANFAAVLDASREVPSAIRSSRLTRLLTVLSALNSSCDASNCRPYFEIGMTYDDVDDLIVGKLGSAEIAHANASKTHLSHLTSN